MPDHSHDRIKKQRLTTKGPHFSFTPPDLASNMGKKPVFSFEFLQGSHCITLCESDDQIAFVSKLKELSQLTWNQIRNTQRHGLGSEKIERSSLHVAIPKAIKEDATFIAIRFSGLKPMVGYQDGRIFHIIWFDKNYDLYDHGN
jgi:hypothetical protein